MPHTTEHYIELEARERNFLRYEAMFWGLAFGACALGGAFLAVSALTAGGGIMATMGAITLGVGAMFTYVKRDEVREEYMLKTGSGRDKIAAKHWAEELGMNRNRSTARAAQPQTEQNIVPKAAAIPASDKIIAEAAPKAAAETHQMIENQANAMRADGKSWGDATKASQQEAANQTLSK